MREELSLKIAILSEKFAPDLSWYEFPENIVDWLGVVAHSVHTGLSAC